MKLFGFVQWIGVFLILALLFGFLGTRQQVDELDRKLAASDEALIETKRERQAYLDRANGLQMQLEEAGAREAKLSDDVEALEKAKAGIENTMKTQVANLEKANEAVEAAKAELDEELAKTSGELETVSGKLEEVTEASQRKEEELTAAINEAKESLALREKEVADLKSSLEDLSNTKSELEKRLEDSAEALRSARTEAQELRTMLDQSEKSKSELQKELETLKSEIEAKEKEAEEAEEEALDAAEEASAAAVEHGRVIAALEETRRQLAEFKNNEFVPEEGVVEVVPAEREVELLGQLRKEREEREAIAAFLVQLQGQVKRLQVELASARSADL